MQAIQDTIDQLVEQSRREMELISHAHAVVLNAFNAFVQAGGMAGGDRAIRGGAPPQ